MSKISQTIVSKCQDLDGMFLGCIDKDNRLRGTLVESLLQILGINPDEPEHTSKAALLKTKILATADMGPDDQEALRIISGAIAIAASGNVEAFKDCKTVASLLLRWDEAHANSAELIPLPDDIIGQMMHRTESISPNLYGIFYDRNGILIETLSPYPRLEVAKQTGVLVVEDWSTLNQLMQESVSEDSDGNSASGATRAFIKGTPKTKYKLADLGKGMFQIKEALKDARIEPNLVVVVHKSSKPVKTATREILGQNVTIRFNEDHVAQQYVRDSLTGSRLQLYGVNLVG